MCAAWPSHVQRHTNVRRDARVWAQPKWTSIALVGQLEEPPPCQRQVARSLWAAEPIRTLRSNGPKAERSERSDRPAQFSSPIAQLAERLAVNQEVRGSRPRRGAHSFRLFSRSSVAEHRLDTARVGGSFPPAGTSSSSFSVWRSRQRACFGNMRPQVRNLPPRPITCVRLGVAVVQRQEPRDVTPLISVRSRSVTPKGMRNLASRTRAAEYRPLKPAGQGSSPWRRTSRSPPRGGIGRRR
jgi:hypothetical protein